MTPISQRQPFIFLLISLIACGDAEENHEPPFGIVLLSALMAIAGVGALIYGAVSGVIPC